MATANPTSYDAVLKEMWPQDAIYDELFEDAPCLAMMPKDTEFYEKVRHIALGYGAGDGIGTNFASAKAAKSSSKLAEFQVTTTTLYALFSITRKLIKQSKNNRGSIVRALARESELKLKAWKRELAIMLFGNGGASRGVGDSAWTVTSNTVTLSDQSKIVNFEIDMPIQFASTDGTSGSVRTGQVTVATVNFTAGSFTTVEANIQTAVPGVLNSDNIFRAGDFGAAMPGIGAFVADSSSPAVLYGLTRTTYLERMAGLRVTAAGLPRETAMKASKDVAVQGGKASHYFLHPTDFLALQFDLQSAGVLLQTKDVASAIGKYQFGMPFEGIALPGPKGLIKCFMDYNVPSGTGFMLDMATWTLASLGELGYIEETDGMRMLREENADAYETRIVGDFACYTEAPAYNARVTQ